MKNLINATSNQVATTGQKVVKVLRVTILLSLGLESTTRDYEVKFSENTNVDETVEANKFVAYAKRKYTSIMHNGGDASVFESSLRTMNA